MNHVRTIPSRPTGWRLLTLTATAAALTFNPVKSLAQTTAAAPAPAKADKEVIELPTFTITETPDNPYRSKQALSSSRVAMDIQDIPQTISVVTSEFMKDSLSARMIDAAKYVTPVVESTLPIGGDRYMIRGFQVSHEFIDGAEISGADGYSSSLAPYNIERIEIIKGPNAILVPGGSPGGQFNPITKSPLGKDQQSLTLELAQYYGTAISTDINRVLSKNDNSIAARVVAAYWHSEGYAMNQFRHGYMFAPSFSWQLTPAHKLIVKAEFMQSRESITSGLPIDPSVGSTGYARIATGLPRDWSFGSEDDFRHRATERLTFELLSNLGEHVTSRLQLIGDHVVREDTGGTGAAIAGFSATRNSNTGLYEPGTITALPAPSSYVFSRSTNSVDLFYTEGHLRNEYAMKFEESFFKTTTVAGLAGNVSKVQFKTYATASRPSVPVTDLGSITYPAWNYPQPTATNGGGNRTGKQKDLQLFVYENLSVFQDRIIFSGGISRFFGSLKRTDSTGIPPANAFPKYKLSTTAKSYGVVLKPIKPVSVFYSYNSSGGSMPSSLNPGTYGPGFRASSGDQTEFGVKVSLLNDRLTASVSHFDIAQQNYPVPNSDYYTLIALGQTAAANALQNPLYLDLNSKGWEFEGTFAITQNLFLLGNYTSFKMRQPITNVRVRAVPDHSGAIYADYRFTSGALNGFGVNVGVDFKSDVVGENATGYTTTVPLPGGGFVPNQPTFLVDGRTLVNVGVTYRAKDWTARIQINNASDKDYILAAGSRTAAVPGDPRSIKGSVTYKF